MLVAGAAGLVAGAMSMAAGEYVSVSSQADTEHADLRREEQELASEPDAELAELAAIYVGRGLDPELAQQVAAQLMAHDALASHARDELGITEMLRARLPGGARVGGQLRGGRRRTARDRGPQPRRDASPGGRGLVARAADPGRAGRAGRRGRPRSGAVRVVLWGALAMAVTTAVGAVFGPAV